MAATQGTPSDPEVHQLIMDRLMRGLAVAQVGRIESYDIDNQVADIKPMVLRQVPSGTEEGLDRTEERPVIPHVRVLHYCFGGFYIHAPPAVGDFVLLVILDQDPSVWQRTGELSPPADRRLHHIAHAVAVPGLFPSTMALDGLGNNLQFGKQGGVTITVTPARMEVDGNTDAAALASKVADLKTAVANMFSSFIGGSGGANFPNPFTPPSDYASTKLKLGG